VGRRSNIEPMAPGNSLGEIGKVLIVFGVGLAIVGVLLLVGGRLPLRLGRLPGDISYQGRNGGFYFPVVTCVVLSVALSLLMWIINYFRR
jgi:ABC-type tungstate transport system substrate-binding protein